MQYNPSIKSKCITAKSKKKGNNIKQETRKERTKMKKLISLLLIAVMSIGLLAGCGKSADQAAEKNALDVIKERGYITMATDAAWAPYEYIGENGEPDGCDIELAKEIAKGLGVELKIINAAFDTLPTYVESGEADMILAAMTITEERKQTMDFSNPYTVAQQYIVVAKDNDSVTTIEDMAGYTIGTHLGTTGDFLVCDEIDLDDGVLHGTDASYAQYKDLTVASLDLNSGSLQAVVCDGPMAENMCLRNPNLKCFPLVYADGSSTDESYGIAVKKGNTALLDAINQILDPLVANGTFDEFFVKHVEASSLLSE